MGMTVNLIAKTDSEIDGLRQMMPEEVRAVIKALYVGLEAEARLAKLGSIFELYPKRLIFDMYKAWQGIHFLLTGTAWGSEPPLGYLMGGTVLGAPSEEEGGEGEADEEEYPGDDGLWGYGPPHALYSHEVRAWWEAIEPLTEEVLRARFDPKAFQEADLYSIKNAPEEEFDWLMAFYEPFREYLRQMVARERGLLVYMT